MSVKIPPVSASDLGSFKVKNVLFSHYHCKGVNKSLHVVTDPIEKRVWYELSNSGEKIYTGPDLNTAIDIYNNL